MLELEIFADKIFYYKNAMTNPQTIIDFIESTDEEIDDSMGIGQWEDWKTSSEDPYHFGEKKLINSTAAENSTKEIKEIYEKIINSINSVIEDYQNRTNEDIGDLQSFGISKYYPGAEMGPHVDFDIKSVDSAKIKLTPTISAILYLNDDYEGGNLYFMEQKIDIKPEAGSMVIFPSVKPFFHESKKIKNGQKYMIPLFCYKV